MGRPVARYYVTLWISPVPPPRPANNDIYGFCRVLTDRALQRKRPAVPDAIDGRGYAGDAEILVLSMLSIF
jgi:hypothetical protein